MSSQLRIKFSAFTFKDLTWTLHSPEFKLIEIVNIVGPQKAPSPALYERCQWVYFRQNGPLREMTNLRNAPILLSFWLVNLGIMSPKLRTHPLTLACTLHSTQPGCIINDITRWVHTAAGFYTCAFFTTPLYNDMGMYTANAIIRQYIRIKNCLLLWQLRAGWLLLPR